MIEKLKKVYYCEHCKKRSFRKSVIAEHEPDCYANAENTPACFICKHFENNGKEGFYCKSHNDQLHTIKAERKGLLEKYPDSFAGSILMPTKCIAFAKLTGIDEEYLFPF